ncbi:MAG: 2-phosphosulfolactate phosphatase [Trueperaceae bacterium]|nr:2-phosphosulfolactate phosphatase [Trueperaceae bacterium]
MDIHVELVPSQRPHQPSNAAADGVARFALVVDVLRSATAAALLFDRGVASVHLCDGLRASRQVAAREGALLVGERDGMPPEGFNFGSSPAALRRAAIQGRPAVLLAADSPRALLLAAARGPTALVGLNNAVAAAEFVGSADPAHVDIICAGFHDTPDLADVMAAGLLVSLLAARAPRSGGGAVSLHGAAAFCLSVLRMTSDPLDGLWVSESGTALRLAGFEEDLAIASAVGSTETLPWVSSTAQVAGRTVVRVGVADDPDRPTKPGSTR